MLVTVFLASLGVQAEALAPGLGVDSAFILVILFTATLLVVLVAMGFFAQEVYSASEVLHLESTRRLPLLALAPKKRWHVFLSHNWANQDVVATIKRQLQLLLPSVRVFLECARYRTSDS